MHIGLSTILTANSIDVADLAPRAEELGFESIWTPEQPTLPVVTEESIPREWGDITDPFVLLSRAAAVTTTLKLGTAVCVVTERHPVSLAKTVATLDMYSSGRFLFGIGTGSIREQSKIFGSDFDHRWTQARESVLAMKELVDEGAERVPRKVLRLPSGILLPEAEAESRTRPSCSAATFRRCSSASSTTRTAGFPSKSLRIVSPRPARGSTILAEAAGRDPRSIDITVAGVPAERDAIRQYERAGADRVLVGLSTAGRKESLAELDRIASAVL